jgi:hypothetical protein
MTRFVLTLTVIILFLVALRRLGSASPPRADGGGSGSKPPARPAPRGAPRALVCGDCGTQFEPNKDGWVCPSCGK